MSVEQPIFAKTVIRVDAPRSGMRGVRSALFRIYGVEQPLHVWDPRFLVPRNDNQK